jgi:hypothetical protein
MKDRCIWHRQSSRDDNMDSNGSIWWRWEVNVSGFTSSKRKMALGGLERGGARGVGVAHV